MGGLGLVEDIALGVQLGGLMVAQQLANYCHDGGLEVLPLVSASVMVLKNDVRHTVGGD